VRPAADASPAFTLLVCPPTEASHHAHAGSRSLKGVLFPLELHMDVVVLLVAAVLVALSLVFIRALERR
jgi:hypothetical protein